MRSRWRSTTEALFGLFWYLALVLLLPLGALLVAGLLYLWQRDLVLESLAVWLAVTMLAYAVFYGRREIKRRRSRATAAAAGATESPAADALPERLAARIDWSEHDRAVWTDCCEAIEEQLADSPPWEQLQDRALTLLAQIADEYNETGKDATWRFTLPEALLIAEETSRRYRLVVTAHLPYADRITIASIMSVYQQQGRILSGWNWFNRARRAVRLVNPVGAVIGELRDRVTDRVLARVGGTMQTAFKRLLLQEIAQVGIDLYSGRLKVSDGELSDYRSAAHRADTARQARPAEPLRMVLLGEISAGKSSLINALADMLEAEADLLPTTDRATVHALALDDDLPVHLVDTPGIESGAGMDELEEFALEADLLLWVVSATQPARAAVSKLRARVAARLDADPQRRTPPSVLIMSHADALKPAASWSPPYDLEAGEGKAASIREALSSVRDQVGFDEATPAIPVCLSTARGLYNIEAVIMQIMTLAEDATQAQFNRRRLELRGRSVKWRERWRQLRNLGTMLGGSGMKR